MRHLSRTNPQDARTVARILARTAQGSHGVVARSELLEAGVTAGQITRLVRTGSLIRVHPGVYRVGHAAPSTEATYLGAVKACGQGALLSGPAAAHLQRLVRGKPPAAEVSCPRERRPSGISTRWIRTGLELDATTLRNIPITTVPRTIVDLAAVLAPPALARAVHEASVIHRVEPDDIEAVLSRRHNWTGCRELRAVLWGETPVTLSRLESGFLERLRDAGLPLPRTNERVGGRIVDCRWPEHQLTVELDGYRFHRTRHAWELDRRREREARARGDDFRRYTYSDVFGDSRAMLRELATALS
jgi:very-short-patch-repair endonuclease